MTRPVNRPLTGKRRTRRVENDDYNGFVRRVIRAYSRRVAAGDIEALGALVQLSTELDQSVADAVAALHHQGFSWSEIGGRLGISKQAAQQRWAIKEGTQWTRMSTGTKSETESPST